MPQTSNSYDSGDSYNTVSIANCTGIMAYAHAHSASSGGPNNDHRQAYIYEIEAFGPYQDLGIHIEKGGAVQIIGVQHLQSGHNLRISKSGTVYGIPLLAITDPGAGNVRIAKSGVVYSLPNGNQSLAVQDLINLPDTEHSYSGGSGDGSQSIDGNFGTAYGSTTPNEIDVYSTHIFARPYLVTAINFRVEMLYYAYGNNEDEGDFNAEIYYTLDYGSTWTQWWGTSG